jgi:hypothetical protein
MESALKREFSTWCYSTARRLALHDPAVLLGVLLCFAPFPPVNLLGFTITCINLVLVRNNRLPKSEIPILRTAFFALVAYACLWTALILWLVHAAIFPTLTGWLEDRGLALWGAIQPPARPMSSAIQRI